MMYKLNKAIGVCSVPGQTEGVNLNGKQQEGHV